MNTNATASLESADDGALLALMARGNRRAFALLYDRYSPLFLGIARKLLDDSVAAEDLVQDVFVEVWRKAETYDPTRGSARTWLLVRLRSRAIDRCRSRTRHATEDESEQILQNISVQQHEDTTLQADRTRARQAMRQIPVEQRQALELAYFAGMSSSEISAHLGVPLGTIKSRLAAGLQKLRQQLSLPSPIRSDEARHDK